MWIICSKINKKQQNDPNKEIKSEKDFDLGELFLPPVSVNKTTRSRNTLEFIHVETKDALWKVEVQTTKARHGSLECYLDKENFKFKLCLDHEVFLFDDIQNVFDFLLSKNEQAENQFDNTIPNHCEFE